MRMKRAPFLLGSRRAKRTKEKAEKVDAIGDPNDMDEDEWELQFDLLKADQVVIADDTNAYQYFGDSIFCAPQEDLLEGKKESHLSTVYGWTDYFFRSRILS